MPEPHIVRLLFNLDADDPTDAVEQFMQQVLAYGLRDWTYGVHNPRTSTSWNVTGRGEVDEVDMGAIQEGLRKSKAVEDLETVLDDAADEASSGEGDGGD